MRRPVLLALVGLAAQLVDGSLGMGYGVTSATLLVAGGIGPAAASAAIHFSEIGTSLISGVAHHTLGNTDWRTVGVLAVPGFLGAFAGATVLVRLDAEVAVPVVAGLLIALGICVTLRFLGPRRLIFGPRPRARFLAPARVLGVAAGGLISKHERARVPLATVSGKTTEPIETSDTLAPCEFPPSPTTHCAR